MSQSGLLDTVAPYLDLGGSAVIYSLVQRPNFSWDPGYFLYILIGFGTLAAALHGLFYYGEKVDKKSDTKTNSKETYPFWHFVSVGVAAYALLYWLLYYALIASLIVGIGIIIGTALAVLHEHERIYKNYPRWQWGVYIFLFLAVSTPCFFVFKDAGVPRVVVSPQSPYVDMNRGQNNNQTATVKSEVAQAYDLNLTAGAPQAKGLISVFINDTLGGPFPIHFLAINQQQIIIIRIVVSSRLPQNGTYPVELNYTYSDSLNVLNHKVYFDSRIIQVNIGTGAPASIGLPPYLPEVIGVAVLSLFVLRLVLTKARSGGMESRAEDGEDAPSPPSAEYRRSARYRPRGS
jgi:hypothetical protein